MTRDALRMNHPRLSELTPDQLLARAAECWRMAEIASTAEVRDALRRLAVRFEGAAEKK
jgi:uncharacterized protein YceH (UPF0502 family)